MADDIAGIYVALQSGLAIGVAGLVNRTEWVVHILFPGGAYRYDWPAQGLVGDFGHDQAKEASFWGRWWADGAKVTVERPDASLTFMAEPGAILDEGGNRYARLSEENVDLTGVWLREASASAAPRIAFLADDRFETAGGLLGLIAEPQFVADLGPHQGRSLFEWPDGGGTYERGPHTLILRRDDGAVLHMLALASPDRMRLGYTWFARER